MDPSALLEISRTSAYRAAHGVVPVRADVDTDGDATVTVTDPEVRTPGFRLRLLGTEATTLRAPFPEREGPPLL